MSLVALVLARGAGACSAELTRGLGFEWLLEEDGRMPKETLADAAPELKGCQVTESGVWE